MTSTLATESVILMSIAKPVFFVAVMIGWAKWVTVLDKDAAYFFLPRRMLNAANLIAGALGFVLWLLIPFFALGLLVFLTLAGGAGYAYMSIRNPKVPEKERWSLSAETFAKLFKPRESKQSKETQLKFIQMASQSSAHFKAVPDEEDPHFEPHLKLDELLSNALMRRAHRLDIGVGATESAVQMSIDGAGYRVDAMSMEEGKRMVDYLKLECGLDVDDLRRKQLGHIKAEVGDYGVHTLQVLTAGSTRGITCTIEIDYEKQRNIAFDQLGLLDSQVDQLKPLLAEAEGLVIVASPSRQGRTTTLYSLLGEHDPYLMDIHAVEDPIEVDLEGVTQHEPDEEGMARAVRSVLLKDPAVLMIAQVPDGDTAQEVIKGTKEGKRVYIGLKADDTFSALKLWAGAIKDLNTVADTLHAVISQRLIRKLCPICRQSYQPDPAALKKMNLPADKISQLYKASGKIITDKREQPCETCQGTGYLGRTAAFEIMVLDDEARQFIRAGDTNGLRNSLRKNRMLMLQEAAMAKVVNGEVAISEVMRAMGGEGKNQ